MRAILIPNRRPRKPGLGRRVLVSAIGPTVLVLIAAACSSPDASNDGSPGTLSVVAAFYPVFEAAQRVGGDLVDVTNLTAPGVEPHDLELAPDQAEAIATADVVLYLGEGFQPAVQDAIGDAEGLHRRPAGRHAYRSSRRAAARRASPSTRTCGWTRCCTRGWSTRCAPRSPRPRRGMRRRSARTPTRSRRRSTRWPTTTPPAWPTAIGRCSSRTTPRSATWPRRTASRRRRSAASHPTPSRARSGWPS